MSTTTKKTGAPLPPSESDQVLIDRYEQEEQARRDAIAACKTQADVDKKLGKKVHACKLKELSKRRNCVEPDPKKKMTDPLGSIADEFNKTNGTKIDFSKLVLQEDAYSGAYVPWWPTNNAGNIVTLPGTSTVQGSSKSGVSIGVGIDLGQQEKIAYFKELDLANKKYKILSDTELKELKKKIDPHIDIKREKACIDLKNKPLDLDKKELDLLHSRGLDYAMKMSIQKNELFKTLSVNEQTDIFKKIWNKGH